MKIRDMLSLYKLPTGRRIFALRLVGKRGTGDAVLDGRIGAALAHDAAVLDSEKEWARQRAQHTPARGKASLVDPSVDRVIGGMADRSNRLCNALGENNPARHSAEVVSRTCFPDGAATLTNAPYDEELIQAEWLRGKLRSPELAPHVAAIGIEADVSELEVLLPIYRTELELLAPALATYEELQTRRREGQELFARVVIRILDQWADDDTNREALLAPILAQNAQVAEAFRKRSKVTDVDPETGEPEAGPAATEAVA